MKNMIEKGWLGKNLAKVFTHTMEKRKVSTLKFKRMLILLCDRTLTLRKKKYKIELFHDSSMKRLEEDEIFRDPVVGDIGLVFGTGFVSF